MIPPQFIPFIIVSVVIAISLHEFSHALAAHLLGDPTPYRQKRLTINPMSHFDLLGTLLILYSSLSGIGFGWGKPVMINPYNFRHPSRDELIVAMAGPAMNLLLASIGAACIHSSILPSTFWVQGVVLFIHLNLGLMIFNLIPIPPLDGSKILGVLFPVTWGNFRQQIEMGGGVLLLIISIIGRPLFALIITPILRFFLWMLGLGA